MKNKKLNLVANGLVLAAALVSHGAHASGAGGLDPGSMKLKIYKMAVSASDLCTDPITVFETSSPEYKDFFAGPELGSGSLANGTYKCIMIEMSDLVKFTSAVTSGACTAGTEVTMDVCRGEGDWGDFQLIDGTKGTCNATRGVEDKVAIFISTGSAGGQDSVAFLPPEVSGSTARGLKLGAELTVSATASGTFVVDGTGQVSGTETDSNGNPSCGMNPPTFTFK